MNNLLFRAQQDQTAISEDDVIPLCSEVAAAARLGDRTVIFVSNELGMGLVPADPTSRLYRDLAGCCNQEFAKHAEEAVFVVSGYPLLLKGEEK